MTSAIPMLLFLGGLMGFGYLMMYCLFQGKELERAEQEAALQKGGELPASSGFFLLAEEAAPSSPAEGATIHSLEDYVRDQQRYAEHFVDQPSVTRLYERSDSELSSRLLHRIEEFLRDEELLVREFLSDPTIERLHRCGAAAGASLAISA